MVKTLPKLIQFAKLLILTSLILLTTPTYAQKLLAEVSSTQIEEGDLLQLTLTANFQTTKTPNLEILKENFTLHGTSASTQYRIINGSYSATTQWDIQLLANKIGELEIPSFQLEKAQSQAIKISVKPASQDLKNYDISFLEAKIDKENPYIQEEIIYTLRFYHQGHLQRGTVAEPKFDKFISDRLSNQNTFEKNINGTNYRVYEWIYALYPQESGELIIPAQEFEGTIYAQQKLLHTEKKSTPITIQVKPIPASFPAQNKWLPAKKLTLKETWLKPQTIEQNSALEREIYLNALGLKSSQLPNFPEEVKNDYRIYNEPPLPSDRTANNSSISQIYQKQMYLMHQAGKIQIPEIQVPWWNTATDKLEIASLPAQELEILATSKAEDKENQLQANNQKSTQENSIQELKTETNNSINLWQLIALFLALAWITTLIILIKIKTNNKNKLAPTNQENDLDALNLTQPISIPEQTDNNYYLSLQKILAEKYQISDWRKLDHPYLELKNQLSQLEKQIFSEEKAISAEQKSQLEKLINELEARPQAKSNKNQLAPLYP